MKVPEIKVKISIEKIFIIFITNCVIEKVYWLAANCSRSSLFSSDLDKVFFCYRNDKQMLVLLQHFLFTKVFLSI
jgi:hypothetical protein